MPSKRPYIVGMGIACMDYICVAAAVEPGGRSPVLDYAVQGGGLTGTAMVACSRLGARASMLGRIGDDEVGQQIGHGLEAEGVDTSGLIRVPGGKSFFSMILVDADTAERTIYFRCDTDIECSTDLISLNALDGADALVLDAHWPEGAEVVSARARELGIPIVLDSNPRPDIAEVLRLADYPIISSDAAFDLAGGPDYSTALRNMMSCGCRAAVITAGAEGVYFADEYGEDHVDGFTVEAVDTTGAGDVFHGAFAFALTQGWATIDAVRFSSAVSAIKCTKLGGRAGIPTYDETMAFLSARSHNNLGG